jgi:hypothetical protein
MKSIVLVCGSGGGNPLVGKSMFINAVLLMTTPDTYGPNTPEVEIKPGATVCNLKEHPLDLEHEQLARQALLKTHDHVYAFEELQGNKGKPYAYVLDRMDARVELNVRSGTRWWVEVECYTQEELDTEMDLIRDRCRHAQGPEAEAEFQASFYAEFGVDAAFDVENMVNEVEGDSAVCGKTFIYLPPGKLALHDRLYVRELLYQLTLNMGHPGRPEGLVSRGFIKRIILYAPTTFIPPNVQLVEMTSFNFDLYQAKGQRLIQQSDGMIMIVARLSEVSFYEKVQQWIVPHILARNYNYPLTLYLVTQHFHTVSTAETNSIRKTLMTQLYKCWPPNPEEKKKLVDYLNRPGVWPISLWSYMSLVCAEPEELQKKYGEDQEMLIEKTYGRRLFAFIGEFPPKIDDAATDPEGSRKRGRTLKTPLIEALESEFKKRMK